MVTVQPVEGLARYGVPTQAQQIDRLEVEGVVDRWMLRMASEESIDVPDRLDVFRVAIQGRLLSPARDQARVQQGRLGSGEVWAETSRSAG